MEYDYDPADYDYSYDDEQADRLADALEDAYILAQGRALALAEDQESEFDEEPPFLAGVGDRMGANTYC